MEVVKDGEKEVITPDTHKYLDPRTLTDEDLPIIVLCDDIRSFTGWAIKAHTAGNYNHSFIMHKPGRLVSQNFGGFEENAIEVYLKPQMMLKFWRIKDLNQSEKILINAAIINRLKLPWYRRTYDFLGTFIGQLLHIKWIQNPFAEFCSEEVNDDYIRPVMRADVMGIKKPSPTELNTIFTSNSQIMECLGYWWSE